ncbi:Panacea domain-containing protein [Iningainema tapete]|uniref:SocA family protein n=1 Tax=Iningainema tapete BLCC-T55 TaxID=2748662 RepID=A0A8J6XAR4_9CYAN|nr:type II toxin-antitoxin system antitoxin SocA domain-containing protein [Iningainema tapete]MBD2771470.1 SocA family protein [Iningainema tapete BLCC-T55]
MLNCYNVADFFIHLANETGSYISNLKLQKLVYYAQAWYLAIYGTPLFEEDFEAWVHGPVIPALYREYKSFGWQPILKDVQKPELSENIAHFLNEVAEVYFACDAYELERMTHQEDPWIKARDGLSMDAPCNAIISKESMREYYKARVEEED